MTNNPKPRVGDMWLYRSYHEKTYFIVISMTNRVNLFKFVSNIKESAEIQWTYIEEMTDNEEWSLLS